MKVKAILFFVLFYCAALLITLPADKVMNFIPENSGVKFVGGSGSLWNGQAAQFAYKKNIYLQNIKWHIDWLALARLQLKVYLEFNNGRQAASGKGFVVLGFSGISLKDFMLDISAAEFFSYTPLDVPAEFSGELSMVIKDASQGFPYCQHLDGSILWQDAQVMLQMGEVDLGSTEIDLSCDNGQIAAYLQQNSQHLTTTAKFLLQEEARYQLQGALNPGEKLPDNIKNGLSWIGDVNDSGETVLNFKGKL